MRNNRICPYCNKKVSVWKCMHYFLHDSRHSICCNHCNNEIRPINNPIRIEYCASAGFISVYLPAIICIQVFHTDLLTSILYSFPFFVLIEFIVMTVTLKRLFFI